MVAPRTWRSRRGRAGYGASAAGNALLSLATLGVYSFWGRTRVRRYLWGTTSFRAEPFEYSGPAASFSAAP